VLKLLALTHEDSLFVHPPDTVAGQDYGEMVDEPAIVTVSPRIPPYFIRSVISVYGNPEVLYMGSYVILYSTGAPGEPVKRIHLDSCDAERGMLSGFAPAITSVDINHDGFTDIIVSFSENTTDRRGPNHFWTFDSTQRIFVSDTSLNRLFQDADIYIDEDAQTISEGGRVGCCRFWFSEHRWNGRTYELFAEESTDPDIDGNEIHVRKEMVNGNLQVVESDTTRR
jgi:hypothetical protein